MVGGVFLVVNRYAILDVMSGSEWERVQMDVLSFAILNFEGTIAGGS